VSIKEVSTERAKPLTGTQVHSDQFFKVGALFPSEHFPNLHKLDISITYYMYIQSRSVKVNSYGKSSELNLSFPAFKSYRTLCMKIYFVLQLKVYVF
jgi:hypothetical protein